MGCIHSPRELGLAAGWGGLRQQGGRPTCFHRGGVATQSLPYFSRVTLAPGVGKVVPGWGVRWVGSALLMEAAIR